MKEINNNLYQFSQFIPPIQFTIHQYLLNVEDAVLVGTGTVQGAKEILSEIREILGDKELKYIFVSHMESDECGGLNVFKKAYPQVKVVCSELTARELYGFGYDISILTQKAGDTLSGSGFDFTFIDYPSEVHLQNGLVFFEKNSGIFFSSDLMLRMGDGRGQIVNSDWNSEIDSINLERICNETALLNLKKALMHLQPVLIAVGHGFCIEV